MTGGNVAAITSAATLVPAFVPPGQLVGDKGDDANHLRRFLAERYRLRNVIERAFCRSKEFRGIATRHDKAARNFRALDEPLTRRQRKWLTAQARPVLTARSSRSFSTRQIHPGPPTHDGGPI